MRRAPHHRKHIKGAIGSLDAALSLVLLMVALGYAYKAMELNFYALKQDEELRVLRIYGSTASELLTSGTNFLCDISTNTGTSYKIPNCIDETKISALSSSQLKEMLLVPKNFNLMVRIGNNEYGDSFGNITEPCTVSGNCSIVGNLRWDIPYRHVYSERRLVIISNGPLDKAELLKCIDGNTTCGLDEEVVEIYVWSENV